MFGIIAAVVVLLAVYVYSYYQNVRRYPKGPTPLPLVGNLLQMGDPKRLHVYMDRCSVRHGDIFTIWVPHPIVVIAGVEAANEAYKGDDIAGRSGRFPDTILNTTENGGVVFSEGDSWREQRRTAISILRDFGMGKNIMEEQVRSSIEDLMRHLDAIKDKDHVDFRWPLQVVVANVINYITFNYKYDFDNCKELTEFCEKFTDYLMRLRANVLVWISMAFPRLGKVLQRFAFNSLMAGARMTQDFIRRDLDKAIATYDENSEPACFVHAYMQRMHRFGGYLSMEQLMDVCLEFFLAGMETTATTLRWAMLHMAANQDVQDKIRAELHALSRERPPGMADRALLPYTMAAMQELQRVVNVGTINLFHRATVDTKVCGVPIPKDTLVTAHIYTMHRRPDYFPEPEKFKPERFLLGDGKTANKKQLEYLNAFSMGKRQCAGEGLARMELFLTLTAILHRYRILPPLEGPLDLTPIDGVVPIPRRNLLQIVPV